MKQFDENRSIVKLAIATTFVILLVLPTNVALFSFLGATAANSSNTFTDRALSALDTKNPVSLTYLNSLTGGGTSVQDYQALIQKWLIPLNVRQVLLDIGWENYSVGKVPYEAWVANWLAASEYFGIQNVFYLEQFTQNGTGSVWINSLLKADPQLTTYNAVGQPVDYVSADNPDVASAVELDMASLYSYYGNFTSWVGLSTGYQSQDPYYSANSSMPVLGYSNSSIEAFVNSKYFRNDLNSSGYLSGVGQDPLWNSYEPAQPMISLQSGEPALSYGATAYGNNTFQNLVAMRFYVPANESSISLRWYGNRVGNPGDLISSIYADENNHIGTNVLFTTSISQNYFSNGSWVWQPAITYTLNLQKGYYWVTFSSNSSNSYQSHYYIFYGNNGQSEFHAQTSSSSNGPWYTIGSTVLWIQNKNGTDLAVYPYVQTTSYHTIGFQPNGFGTSGIQSTQSFVANSSFSFNTLFVYLQSHTYDPRNLTLNIRDTTSGKLIGSGVLSESSVHGLEGWIPITLNDVITTTKGNNYTMQLIENITNPSWLAALSAANISPAETGFQNESSYWLFKLGLMNLTQTQFDYGQISVANSPVSAGNSVAFKFVPSFNESIDSLQILMDNGGTSDTNYSSGSLSMSLWSNNATSNLPIKPVLETITLAGQSIPQNGWLDFNGINQELQAGQPYWIVFSTDGNQTFSFAGLSNPYRSVTLHSLNQGLTWTPLPQSVEYSYQLVLSRETIGMTTNEIPQVNLGGSTVFAQSFTPQVNEQVSGIFLGPFHLDSLLQPNGHLSVSIRPDNGSGAPSGFTLASGVYYGGNMTTTSLVPVQLDSVAKLQQGERYWMVIQSVGATFSMSPVVYSDTQNTTQTNLNTLFSNDGGSRWSSLTGNTTYVVLPYSILSPPNSLPNLNTQQIFDDLSAYHSYPTNEGQLKGWNAYVQSSEAFVYQSIANWLQSHSTKSWVFYAGIQPNVIDQLGLSNVLVPLGNPPSDCSGFSNSLLTHTPVQGGQYSLIGNSQLVQNCTSGIAAMSTNLGYLSYTPSFGASGASSPVLLIGDSSSSNLANYFSIAYNVTYVDINSNHNLTGLGSLTNFHDILWSAGGNSSVSNFVMTQLASYVESGGNLVDIGTPPAWMNSMIGLDLTSISKYSTNSTRSGVSQNLTSTYDSFTNHTAYQSRLTINVISSNTSFAEEPGLVLSFNHFGNGSVTVSDDTAGDLGQLSEGLVVLSNILSYNSNGGSSPFWYGSNGEQGLIYSISGSYGQPLLVWVSNPTNSTAVISLHIDGKYYGPGTNWRLLSLSDLSSIWENNTALVVNASVQPQSWKLFYLIPNGVNPLILFSNLETTSQYSYPDQGLYTMKGLPNQSALVAIGSNKEVVSVLLNDQRNLTQLSSTSALLASTSGWYYDNSSNILFAKYITSGSDSLRVIYSSQQVTIQPGIDIPMIAGIVIVLFAAEVGVYVFVRSYYKKN